MKNIIDTIETFNDADVNFLQNSLHHQFQQHFNFLVEHIKSIQTITFGFAQVDEDCYAMTDFTLIKNNGYTYNYILDYSDNPEPEICNWEFFKSQIEVIQSFKHYLNNSVRICCAVFGCGTLTFHNENTPEDD